MYSLHRSQSNPVKKSLSQMMLLLFWNSACGFQLTQANRQSPLAYKALDVDWAWPSITPLTSSPTTLHFTFIVSATFSSSIMLGFWSSWTCSFLCYPVPLDISHLLLGSAECPLLGEVFLPTLHKRRPPLILLITLPNSLIMLSFSPLYQQWMFIFIVCLFLE